MHKNRRQTSRITAKFVHLSRPKIQTGEYSSILVVLIGILLRIAFCRAGFARLTPDYPAEPARWSPCCL